MGIQYENIPIALSIMFLWGFVVPFVLIRFLKLIFWIEDLLSEFIDKIYKRRNDT